MNATPPGRMDRRRVRTRAALLRAGRDLFAHRAVDGVSIDDIVVAADVAKGSFYNHFADKDALATELARQARLTVEAQVARVGADVADPAERVARALCAFVRGAVDDPTGARLMLRLFPGAEVADAPMDAGVRADVRAGLEAGRFSALSLEAGVLMAVGIAQVAVARVLDPHRAQDADGLARDLAFGLLRGLGLEPRAASDVARCAASHIFTD